MPEHLMFFCFKLRTSSFQRMLFSIFAKLNANNKSLSPQSSPQMISYRSDIITIPFTKTGKEPCRVRPAIGKISYETGFSTSKMNLLSHGHIVLKS